MYIYVELFNIYIQQIVMVDIRSPENFIETQRDLRMFIPDRKYHVISLLRATRGILFKRNHSNWTDFKEHMKGTIPFAKIFDLMLAICLRHEHPQATGHSNGCHRLLALW